MRKTTSTFYIELPVI